MYVVSKRKLCNHGKNNIQIFVIMSLHFELPEYKKVLLSNTYLTSQQMD